MTGLAGVRRGLRDSIAVLGALVIIVTCIIWLASLAPLFFDFGDPYSSAFLVSTTAAGALWIGYSLFDYRRIRGAAKKVKLSAQTIKSLSSGMQILSIEAFVLVAAVLLAFLLASPVLKLTAFLLLSLALALLFLLLVAQRETEYRLLVR